MEKSFSSALTWGQWIGKTLVVLTSAGQAIMEDFPESEEKSDDDSEKSE